MRNNRTTIPPQKDKFLKIRGSLTSSLDLEPTDFNLLRSLEDFISAMLIGNKEIFEKSFFLY